MAPPFARASLTLDYPLYALDRDPEDAKRFIVGGGGGSWHSGVGNKITVIEASSQEELRIANQLELSRDEDSVTSIAVAPPAPNKPRTMRVFAGVNSSPVEIAKGKNQHLRAFAVEAPTQSSRGGGGGGGAASPSKSPARSASWEQKANNSNNTTELSRTALFTNPSSDTYQRVLRVTGTTGVAGYLGVAASAMGPDPQIAVFDAGAAGATRPRLRGLMELPRDAEDLDVVQTGDDEFQVAFCYKHELHTFSVGKQNGDPELIFTMPDDHGRRPVFRSVRYLSKDFLLAVANLPSRSGVLIQGFRLPSPGHDKARIAITARIPRKISATSLAVVNLSPPSPVWAPLGHTQFVVAVAGHDSSISLYTLEHKPSDVLNLLYDLLPLRTLVNVHGSGAITGLAFSRFATPKTHARAQVVRLASISLEKTVAVETIPLRKHVDGQPRNPKAPPRPARYVVAMKSRRPSTRPIVMALTIIVLLMAIVGQSVMEMYGRSQPVVFSTRFMPSWHGSLRSPDLAAADVPLENNNNNRLLSKLAGAGASVAGETMVLFETQHPEAQADRRIQAGVHDAAVHGPAKTWDELGADQKRVWRERLREAGAWSQGMGESVFKGILFGEIAGAIGRAMEG